MNESPASPGWWVYIVECADRTLYTGMTNNLTSRLTAHAEGRGAKYTKYRRPVTLRYAESANTKGLALRREAAIKRLSRTDKLSLITAKPPP
ncbi:MAG: GIY-YIG nuclease family protein [Nitrospira sp.]